MRQGDIQFLGIGALKAGTTSLHEYMRTHPELFLPEAKEQQYFNHDPIFADGWDAYAAVALLGAPRFRQRGLIVPHYLGGPVVWSDETVALSRPAHEIVAERIADHFPDLKLIVMLRNPTERAVSSYWQSVALGDEERPMEVVFDELLADEQLERDRIHPVEGHQHVVAGEYGRLLAAYVDRFPRSQLFVGSTHELGRNATEFMREVWRYLGVDDGHVPPNLEQRFQTRGTGSRSQGFTALPGKARQVPGVARIWASLPPAARARIRHRLRLLAHRRDQRQRMDLDAPSADPDRALLDRLDQHYERDLESLEQLVGPVSGVTTGSGFPAPAPVG